MQHGWPRPRAQGPGPRSISIATLSHPAARDIDDIKVEVGPLVFKLMIAGLYSLTGREISVRSAVSSRSPEEANCVFFSSQAQGPQIPQQERACVHDILFPIFMFPGQLVHTTAPPVE